MGLINPTLPTVSQPRGSEEVDILNALTAILTLVNGQLDDVNLSSALGVLLGLTQGITVRRGKFVQAANGSRNNVAYGALSNGPDVVSGVVLPTDGCMFIAFSALWKGSLSASTQAAVFLNAVQLKRPASDNPPVVQEASMTGQAAYTWLTSGANGLASPATASADASSVTTGQIVSQPGISQGGPMIVQAAAGTYDVSVQYKSAGAVDAKERKLWVWTIGF